MTKILPQMRALEGAAFAPEYQPVFHVIEADDLLRSVIASAHDVGIFHVKPYFYQRSSSAFSGSVVRGPGNTGPIPQ
jgi:hypothetical protein